MTHHPKQYKQNKVHNVQNTSNSIIQDTVINLGRKKLNLRRLNNILELITLNKSFEYSYTGILIYISTHVQYSLIILPPFSPLYMPSCQTKLHIGFNSLATSHTANEI